MPRVSEGQDFGRVWKHTQAACSVQFMMENDPAVGKTPEYSPWQKNTSDKETNMQRIQRSEGKKFIPVVTTNQINEVKLLELHDPGLQHEIIMQNTFFTFFRWGQGITELHHLVFHMNAISKFGANSQKK